MCACSVASIKSDSLRSHGLQPARFLCPWDFPSKNTGVGMEKLDKAEEISRKACMSYMFHPVWQSQFSQRATDYQTVKKCWNGYIPWLSSCWTGLLCLKCWRSIILNKKRGDLRHFVIIMNCRETVCRRENPDISWTSSMTTRSAFIILFSIWFPG